MQFDEKVLAALDVLTEAAENDYELYRICTLVRDLITPPVAEVIDEKRQRFNGEVFVKNKGHNDNHLVHTHGIHRAIWEYYHGEVPTGSLVHHENQDAADNRIENLSLKTIAEHRIIHNTYLKKNRNVSKCRQKKTFICANCGCEFVATNMGANRFCSEKCSKKFSYKTKLEQRVCPVCGRTFDTFKYGKTKYCSRHCAMILRHRKNPAT